MIFSMNPFGARHLGRFIARLQVDIEAA